MSAITLPTTILEVPRTYRPPSGYYDLPCHWVFSGADLVNGINALKQSVRIDHGYGDFYLRRCCGMASVLGIKTGQFQIKNGVGLDFLQVGPVYVNNAQDEMSYPVEELYPEDGAIRFDLYNPLKQTVSPQIVFFGVGRHPGDMNPMEIQAGYPFPFLPKTEIYTSSVTIASWASGGVPSPTISAIQRVLNYDFDLLKIELAYSSPGGPINSVAGLTLFDAARQQTSNHPINDQYWNGNVNQPNATAMGAVIPPLFYPQGSNLRLDLTPLSIGALGNIVVTVSFVGRNRIPL